MNWLKFTCFLAISTLLACTKPPNYPVQPVIEFKSLSRNSLPQGNLNTDSLTITFTYTDGDGDLGDMNNQASVYSTALRTGFEASTFSIPFVPVQGAGNGISGEISIQAFTACCIHPERNQICMPFDDYPIDTLQFEIYIVDRAGNKSNTIVADPNFLICE